MVYRAVRGNLLGDLPEVTEVTEVIMRERRSEKNSAIVECITASQRSTNLDGAKGIASSPGATDAIYRFSHGPYSFAACRFNRNVTPEGGRSRFAKEKLVRTTTTTVRSIVGNAR